MHARLLWHGRELDVRGTLAPGFLISQGEVLVRLHNVQPPLPGDKATDVWVPASSVQPVISPSSGHHADAEPSPLLLRSSMHELPAGQSRDYALRTLSVTMSQFVTQYGRRISLSPSVADMIELNIVIDVPVHSEATTTEEGRGARKDALSAETGIEFSPEDGLPMGTRVDFSAEGALPMGTGVDFSSEDALRASTGIDYLWRFHVATRPGSTRRAMWTPPAPAFAERNLDSRDRAQAAHYVGQLPLWLTTRRFWSVYRWHDDRLQHIVQFSLPASLRRALTRRFRLHTV